MICAPIALRIGCRFARKRPWTRSDKSGIRLDLTSVADSGDIQVSAYIYGCETPSFLGRFGRWLTAPITLICTWRELCCHAPASVPNGGSVRVLPDLTYHSA